MARQNPWEEVDRWVSQKLRDRDTERKFNREIERRSRKHDSALRLVSKSSLRALLALANSAPDDKKSASLRVAIQEVLRVV